MYCNHPKLLNPNPQMFEIGIAPKLRTRMDVARNILDISVIPRSRLKVKNLSIFEVEALELQHQDRPQAQGYRKLVSSGLRKQ